MKNTCAILTGDRQFRLVEEEFRVSGTPLVQVTHVGICGTDMDWWLEGSAHVGQVLGHEFAGTVVDPGDSDLRVGDRVAGYTQNIRSEFCGHCYACLQGDHDDCTNRKVHTWKGGDLSHPGAYSRYTTWFPGSFFRLPENVSSEEGALLEPLAVTLHAVNRTDIRPGDKVLVLGGGIIGCSTAEWCRSKGAGLVVITEIVPEKREVIRGFRCADYVLDAAAEDLFAQYQALSGGGFDVVFDCCGVAAAVNGAIAHAFCEDVRARKCMTSVALHRGEEMAIRYNDLILKEVVWKGTKGHFPEEFVQVLDAVASGSVNVKKFITKKIPFADLQRGFEELNAMGGTPGKAMLVMD